MFEWLGDHSGSRHTVVLCRLLPAAATPGVRSVVTPRLFQRDTAAFAPRAVQSKRYVV